MNTSKYYIPNTFQIGRFRVENDDYHTQHNISECSFPSCRFKMNDWTDLVTFEKMTGYRPTNMVDKSYEINKVITGNVQTVDNTSIRGFRLVDHNSSSVYGRFSSRGFYSYPWEGYIILRDPRGWNIEVKESEILDLIIKQGIKVLDGGELDTSFIYGWKEDHEKPHLSSGFTLISEDDPNITKDDMIHEADIVQSLEDNPPIRSKQLVAGKIYDFESKSKKNRVLYLGNIRVPTKSSISFIMENSYIRLFKEYQDFIQNKERKHYDPFNIANTIFSWENEKYVANIKDFDNWSYKHVFLVIKDFGWEHFNHGYRSVETDADSYIHKRYVGGKHDDTLDFIDNVIYPQIGNKIKNESENQNIKIDASSEGSIYGSRKPNVKNYRYQGYTFEEILKGYHDFINTIKERRDKLVSIFPIEAPSDIETFKSNLLKASI